MRYTLRRPAVLTIAILAIVTASAWLLRSNTGAAKTPPPAQTDEQSPQAAENHVTAKLPQASPAAKAADAPKAAEPAVAPRSPRIAASPKISESPKNVGEYHRLLETVGTMTAAHCYQTYLNISLLADGKAKGIYSAKEASSLLDSILSVLDSVDRKLAVLGKTDLDRQDHDSLEQMRDLSDLLRRQGKQLKSFWESGKEDDAAKYEEIRKDSWAAISRLMGTGR